MKKIVLVFVLLTLLFNYPSSVFASGPKYTMRQRFGVGGSSLDAMGKQGNGWYFSWSYKPGRKIYYNIDFLGLLGMGKTDVRGAQPEPAPESVESPTCQKYKDYILSKGKQLYPDNMMWTIGNEIGWDDERTPEKYADDFPKWYACLKSINPTFKVGSGALISLYHKLPRDWNQGCATDPSIDGGIAYFKKYIELLRTKNNLPDFIVNHAYTYCKLGGTTASNFMDEIREQRQLMKELGLQSKDLIINEWSDFSDNSINYLKDTVNFLMSATDKNVGNPEDEYRLVQKWAWFYFESSNSVPKWKNAYLYNSSTGDLTALGYAYKALIPDPSPIGSYSTYMAGHCNIYGWACDGSYFEKPIQVDIYANDATTNNQPVWVGSTQASLPHGSGSDPVVKNNCGGINDHDFVFTLPASSQFRDGKEHTYFAAGINIDSTGTRVDKDSNGNFKHTWFNFWHTNKMTCLKPTPTPTYTPGDLNHDGKVDIFDYDILLQNFGNAACGNTADIDGNCKVDIFDYNILVQNFGK